jgi:lipopolysaccharide export system permease protein
VQAPFSKLLPNRLPLTEPAAKGTEEKICGMDSLQRRAAQTPCAHLSNTTPMLLLSRYILVQFIRNLGMITASFITLYLLIDFFEKIDNFMEKGKSLSLVASFFLANIPYVIDLMSPVCILLAGVVTLGILNHSNELIALKACGIPLKKIIYPIIGAAMACIVLLLAMAQWILPVTISTTNHIWNKEVKGKLPLGIYRNGRYYYHGAQGFYSFSRPDPQKNEFRHFSYTVWSSEYSTQLLIAANTAIWSDGTWTLHDGQLQRSDEAGQLRTEMFTSRVFGFPEVPDDFFVPAYRSMELSLAQLYQETQRARTDEEQARAWSMLYGKISYIFLGLPLLLLGLPLVLIVYRNWGRDLSLAIPVSCAMAFACWGGYTILQSLAQAGYIPPLAAALSVHVAVGGLGLFLLAREEL